MSKNVSDTFDLIREKVRAMDPETVEIFATAYVIRRLTETALSGWRFSVVLTLLGALCALAGAEFGLAGVWFVVAAGAAALAADGLRYLDEKRGRS